MEFRRERSVQGLFCKQCGWHFVTTYISAVQLDETNYEVHACGGDYRNESHIKAVSELSGRNFLGARQLLQQHDPVVLMIRQYAFQTRWEAHVMTRHRLEAQVRSVVEAE